jgi:hypothetical protein
MATTGRTASDDGFAGRTHARRMLARYVEALRMDAGITPAEIGRFAIDAHAADHAFYLLVVPMLSRCFPAIAPSTVDELGCAFYGIFRMVLAMDRVVDRHESAPLYDGLVHYTVALRRLSAVFPAASPIWAGLSTRLHHSVDQIRTERELSDDDERAAFVTVAAGKSSLIQLTVDWLEALEPAPSGLADRLRASLIDKHLGMQWLDDINDFVVDTEQGQATWARTRLGIHAKVAGLDLSEIAAPRQKRLLFASGLGEELLRETNAHFAAALDDVAGLDLPEYVATIRSYIERTALILDAIAGERMAAQTRLDTARKAAEERP